LNKSQRLVGKKMVGEIFGKKEHISVFPLKAFYNKFPFENETNELRFGISVPKKKFKRAVDRNEIKRLVKEAIRLNKTFLQESLYTQDISMHIMVVCYFEKIPDYITVEKRIKQLLERLAKRINCDE
jgi:ribonuclease P protein component